MNQSVKVHSGKKYLRNIYPADRDDPKRDVPIEVDVYCVNEAFDVPGILTHAVKKILCPGRRGKADKIKDLKEAIDSIQRQIDVWERWERQEQISDIPPVSDSDKVGMKPLEP
jgi:hypothetical protein